MEVNGINEVYKLLKGKAEGFKIRKIKYKIWLEVYLIKGIFDKVKF